MAVPSTRARLADRNWQPTSGSGASCGKFACFPDLVDGFQGAADPTAEGLWRARARRWGMTGRRVGSLGRAAIFIDTVGFALLFPAASIPAPSLWEAVAGDAAEPFASGMGPAEQKVWAWKDQLPRHSQAWYGRFVGNRGPRVSPAMLALLYPGDGDVADHASLPLSQPAHEIASALIGGPLPSDVLRAGVGRRHYQRAVNELQRSLLVTTAGVQENRTGWPSAVLDLTCRRFNVGGQRDHRLATERFVQTMVEDTPRSCAEASDGRPPEPGTSSTPSSPPESPSARPTVTGPPRPRHADHRRPPSILLELAALRPCPSRRHPQVAAGPERRERTPNVLPSVVAAASGPHGAPMRCVGGRVSTPVEN